MRELKATEEVYENYTLHIDGRVYSNRRKRFLTPCKNGDGYLTVKFSNDGKEKTVSIHRLVALAFIPNPHNKETVNHINGIKTDNRIENLEWATKGENIIHAYNTGLNSLNAAWKKVKKIVLNQSTGIFYESATEASLSIGIPNKTLNNYLLGITPNKTNLIYV